MDAKAGLEVWALVAEAPKYEVSTLGRVRFAETGCLRKLAASRSGYVQVSLQAGRGRIMRAVHRLVAQAFIPNPEAKPEVDHVNRIRNDNRLQNLRWATRQENLRTRRANPSQAHARGHSVVQMREGVRQAEWPTITAAAKAMKVSVAAISSCIRRGPRATCAGYQWVRAQSLEALPEGELWRVATDRGTTFEVSNFGALRTLEGMRSMGTPDAAGYMQALRGGRTFRIHRLVACAFCVQPHPGATTVNHRDFDKANNRAENLEWVTRAENSQHACRAGKGRCVAIRRSGGGQDDRVFLSIKAAAASVGVSRESIKAAMRRNGTSRGFRWFRVEPETPVVLPGLEPPVALPEPEPPVALPEPEPPVALPGPESPVALSGPEPPARPEPSCDDAMDAYLESLGFC